MLELFNREETEIIEGEVVEIQIDRPATGTVGCLVPQLRIPKRQNTIPTLRKGRMACLTVLSGDQSGQVDLENHRHGDHL